MMARRQIMRSPPSHTRAQDRSEMLNSGIFPALSDENTLCFTHRVLREETSDCLKEQLMEKDVHISWLQDALTTEREKSAQLQYRCGLQGAELRRRETQIQRSKEKLAQVTDRHKHRGASMEILNVLPKRTGRRDPGLKTARADGRTEEALRLLLDRREAELREAMKLRHGLTTLLHMLREDMAQTLQENNPDLEDEMGENVLVQSEQGLGDHVTGGVVQEWMQVQKRLKELMSYTQSAQGTDQEKLLAQLQDELEQSRRLIQTQQQILQDSVSTPLPPALMDCCFLEEWARLQAQWEELQRQRRSFQQERRAFTEAAIRLGHERTEFEQQKASQLKSDFLNFSPVDNSSQWNRRESTALSDLRAVASDQLYLSPCASPSPEGQRSEVRPGRSGVMTPSTPELYCALKLPYFRSERILRSPDGHDSDWPF